MEVLARHPFLTGVAPATLEIVARYARPERIPAPQYIFREGQAADVFFLLERGHVALEIHAPGRGVHVLDTVGPGGVVGWSWLVPPYRWFCDGRVTDEAFALVVDGLSLQEALELEPAAGYQLLQRVAHVMYTRLQATRLRLLDLYGPPDG